MKAASAPLCKCVCVYERRGGIRFLADLPRSVIVCVCVFLSKHTHTQTHIHTLATKMLGGRGKAYFLGGAVCCVCVCVCDGSRRERRETEARRRRELFLDFLLNAFFFYDTLVTHHIDCIL